MIALYYIRRYTNIIPKLDSINHMNTNLLMVHYSEIYIYYITLYDWKCLQQGGRIQDDNILDMMKISLLKYPRICNKIDSWPDNRLIEYKHGRKTKFLDICRLTYLPNMFNNALLY